MPLTFSTTDGSPTCTLSSWTVATDEQLVEALAWLYVQKHAHANAVIRDLAAFPAAFIGKEIDNAIETLRYRIDDIADDLISSDEEVREKAQKKLNARVSHRDGLLFQHVSWIAARMQFPDAEATPPHVREADKGFDGFLIEHPAGQAGLSKVIICEDKASTNPRGLVTSSIWPEIKDIIEGKKDREISAAVGALLSNVPPEDREAILAATIWERAKRFRVALTAGADQEKEGGYLHLFSGFEEQAAGDVAVRLGEVMPVPQVRVYLNDLAEKVISELEDMRADV